MLVVHLAFGIISGVLAAVLSHAMGFSFWGVVGCYILAANVGLLASLAAALLREPGKASRFAAITAYHRSSAAAPLR
jgi:hypothetical protein